MTVREIGLPSTLQDLPEQMQRLLVDTIPGIVWSARADGADDFVNRRLCEYTGLRPEDLGGAGWQEIIHPDDREGCRSRWLQSVASGEPFEFEYRLRRHDGVYRWHLGRGVALREGGRIVRWFGTCTDIEAQKKAERRLEEASRSLESEVAARTEALRASEARFRTFMDSVPAVAWIKDAGFRYTWVNQGFPQQEGLKPGPFIGRTDAEVWGEEAARRFREFDREALRRDAAIQTTSKDPLRTGSSAHWLVVRFPLLDATGAMGTAGIAIDITDRYELEKVVRENEARITQAAETVRQLMNRLVHAQEAERRKLAADLHDLIGQKLTALGINLDIVRQRMPQAGAVALAPRLHQMSTLLEETIGAIREVLSDLRPQVLDEHGLSAALFQYASTFEARTGLRVQVHGAERRIPLPHDVAIALFRIAQEALTNAAKHSGASRVVVRVAKSPERVELHVEDDGRGGLDRRQMARGAGNGKDNEGWGLPMMRERAEAVGGRLSIEHADPGTRILVEVPLGDADQRHPR